jgi:hypothetical protein
MDKSVNEADQNLYVLRDPMILTIDQTTARLDNIDAGLRVLALRIETLEGEMRRVIQSLNNSTIALNSLIDAVSADDDGATGTEFDLSGNPYPASRN